MQINTFRELSIAIIPQKSTTKSVSNDSDSPRFSDALELIKKQNVTYSPTKTNPPSREEVIDKKLAELRRIHEEFDYSALSCAAESYAVIEKRFKEAFPDEFEMARSFGYLTRSLPEYCAISKEFIKEASRCYDSIEEINKYRGYDGLSYEEIESVICEKYAGKETLRDQLNLLGELTEAGVINHNCMKNSVYLGPVFFDKIAVGLSDKYNLYDMSGNIDRNAFDKAMSGEKFSRDELYAFTADLSFEMPDLFDVFDKIFESIEERAIENKRQNKTISEPTYNLTDEQIEYFKNKYGEDFVYGNENGKIDHSNKFDDYSDGDTREFFNELADVGVISEKDAEYASGKKCHGRVWTFEIINKNIDPLAPGNLRPMGNVSAAIQYVDPGFSVGEKYTWAEFGDKLIQSAEKFNNLRNNQVEYEKFVKENHMVIDSMDSDYLPSLVRTFNLIKMMFE